MWEKIALSLVTCCFKAIAILPYRVLYILSDLLYPVVYYLVKYRRKVVRKNLVNSFPEKSVDEIVTIEKKFYRHFCNYFVETIKLLHISDEEMRRRLEFVNVEVLEKLCQDGKPVLLYLGHQGNWEYVTSIMLWLTGDMVGCQTYHPLSNKVMDKFFLRLRSRFNTLSVSQKQTLRLVLTLLKEGKQPILGLIADQRPRRKFATTWMRFLNQPTPLITGGETMGERIGANYVYGSMTCVKRGYYKMTIQPIEPIEGEEFSYVKQYMRMLEKDIQREPHLWLWTHKRWKFHYDKEDLL